MLKPLDNQNAVGFKVARTLVSVHGRKYCPVWNDLDQPITLKYGTPIATVSPIADIVRSCTDEESIGDIKQQTSTIDPDINKKYIHNLNIFNKIINVYNTNKQQDAIYQTNNHTQIRAVILKRMQQTTQKVTHVIPTEMTHNIITGTEHMRVRLQPNRKRTYTKQ